MNRERKLSKILGSKHESQSKGDSKECEVARKKLDLEANNHVVESEMITGNDRLMKGGS